VHIATRRAARHQGEPAADGVIRSQPEDFDVTELLAFEPSRDGPHSLVQVEKRGMTTLQLIDVIARFARVKTREIGYSGLKDRHAVTRQWLSLPFDPDRDWSALSSQDLRVLQATRNARKLRIGSHRANAFVLVVRRLGGDVAGLPERIERVAEVGVPNYFGPQRFGRHGDNLRRARRWFVDGLDLARRQRRFALSAARSWLFNRVLGERVGRGDWDRLLDGEPVCLDGSRSFFVPEDAADGDLTERLRRMDVHPSGPLWGAGDSAATGECAHLEQQVAGSLAWLARGLEESGPKQERRALRLPVRELDYAIEGDVLTLRFELGRGAFATSVLNEILAVDELYIPA